MRVILVIKVERLGGPNKKPLKPGSIVGESGLGGSKLIQFYSVDVSLHEMTHFSRNHV